MLLIHRSERADALVAALGQVLRHPTGDPFEPAVVAVPSRGVERWLAQQLSHTLGAGPDGDGICANVVFPSYARFLDDAAAAADDDYHDAVERWSAERVVWPLLAVIDRCAPAEPWCRELATHLGAAPDGTYTHAGRRFAVAGKLAGLFERYGRARPQMIRDWRAGRDEQGDGSPMPDDLRWQAELWRRLRAELDIPSPAELLDAACARITAGPSFSIFGATRIPPARMQILAALAQHRDLHLWLHHPSPALWNAAANERPGRRRERGPVVASPLLASMSRDVRELQQLLNTVDHRDEHHPIPARPDTLLGRIQTELAADIASGGAPADPADTSLQVHAAHGPARQVEVLRETVLGLLDTDSTLEPRDVLIMCPDVEAYAPLIAASFGMVDEPDGHPAARLRVRLADRSLRQTNPLLRLLSQLLELAASRVTATQLLDLAGAGPVRAKFGFDDDDIERLRDWSVTAGARWGLDADHRETYGLQHLGQGTWRAALDRLLLGVAMEDDANWLGSALPVDDVDSADIDLVGRFAELVDRVDHTVRLLEQKHLVARWMQLLAELVDDLGAGDQPWQAMQVRTELEEVAESAADTDVELALADVTALLRGRLAGRPTRASFRTGTLTVCTLVPMRSVPHRVVCLLGMDDDAFPRRAVPDGDDVLARDPRTGERDPRSEDRQLFLDAVCAAQEHLVITYTGADPRSGAPVPPCVPLGELLDAVEAAAGRPAREQVVIHHPLQPFDPRNFEVGELVAARPFSFDPAGLAGAMAAVRPRLPVPALVTDRLEPAPAEDTVALDDLVRFLQHPSRGFLRQRLEIGTFTDDDDPVDALTVELDGLQGWAIGERVLRHCMTGAAPPIAARLEYLRGELPPGPLGRQAMRTIGHRVDDLLTASAPERQTVADSVDVSVPLADGRLVTGTVTGVRGSTILAVTYSRLGARHRLAAWVRYLALSASTGDSSCRAVTIGRQRDGVGRAVLFGANAAVAADVLTLLARIRDAGLREPLPLALETSAEYAKWRKRGVDREQAEADARLTWEAGRYEPERDEPEHVLTFGAKTPFAHLLEQPPDDDLRFPDEPTRFGALARSVWAPLSEVEKVEFQ